MLHLMVERTYLNTYSFSVNFVSVQVNVHRASFLSVLKVLKREATGLCKLHILLPVLLEIPLYEDANSSSSPPSQFLGCFVCVFNSLLLELVLAFAY